MFLPDERRPSAVDVVACMCHCTRAEHASVHVCECASAVQRPVTKRQATAAAASVDVADNV